MSLQYTISALKMLCLSPRGASLPGQKELVVTDCTRKERKDFIHAAQQAKNSYDIAYE
jgi:hypothetical protein